MQLRSRRFRASSPDDVVLLVRLLAGNPATSAAILCCLNTADASHLRRLHPAVAAVVADVPWCDTGTAVVDAVRWRAAFPAAVGVKVAPTGGGPVPLGGRVVSLPPSLQELDISFAAYDYDSALPAGVSLAGLTRLRVLHAENTPLDAAMLASLPPSLLELHVAHCSKLHEGASFAHLPALHTLGVSYTYMDDAPLASMPPSLVSLHACACVFLTPAAVLPPLPALRLLDVSRTSIGDALVASLLAALVELRLSSCCRVTPAATLDHLPALRALHSYGTDLAPGVLSACRARGCAVPVAGGLRGARGFVQSVALLAEGRAARGGTRGRGAEAGGAGGGGVANLGLTAGSDVHALAALRDGHRLAAGLWNEGVEIWEVGPVPPVRTAKVDCGYCGVLALLVLPAGHLAAGCEDSRVRIIDVDTGAVVTKLEGHTDRVRALAALPDGSLVSGSNDRTVRVWDVGTRACVATLAGHSGWISALAVLSDGRLASGSADGTVRLWNVGTRTCVSVLSGHTDRVIALAALPDGRLVSGSYDRSNRVWDTRPAAMAPASHAAGTVPMVAFAHGLLTPSVLLPLPDGRLACTGKRAVHLLHVPLPAPYE